jgi:hypothetical protein
VTTTTICTTSTPIEYDSLDPLNNLDLEIDIVDSHLRATNPLSFPMCESALASLTMNFNDDEKLFDVIPYFDDPWDKLHFSSPIDFLPKLPTPLACP